MASYDYQNKKFHIVSNLAIVMQMKCCLPGRKQTFLYCFYDISVICMEAAHIFDSLLILGVINPTEHISLFYQTLSVRYYQLSSLYTSIVQTKLQFCI